MVDHVTNPMPFASRGGTTPISMTVFHCVNGMRLVDPVADLALGIRTLRAANTDRSHGQCPHAYRDTCTAHWILGSVIVASSLLDLSAVILLLHGMHAFKSLSDLTKQRISEVIMLISEAAIFVSAVLVSHFDMLAAPETAEARCVSCFFMRHVRHAVSLTITQHAPVLSLHFQQTHVLSDVTANVMFVSQNSRNDEQCGDQVAPLTVPAPASNALLSLAWSSHALEAFLQTC